MRGQLTKLDRKTLSALIVIDVHARDVAVDLARQGVASDSDFEWMSQLRYNWEDGEVSVRMINAQINYGYEYLGNGGRLVITPLTDRYIVLGGGGAGKAERKLSRVNHVKGSSGWAAICAPAAPSSPTPLTDAGVIAL